MPDLNKIYIYRMTHIENIPHILTHGITHISSPRSNKAYVPIGDGSLISSRANYDMPNGRKLGDYIPFYFGVRMPMLYVMQKGFNNVAATRAQDVVYCVSNVQKVLDLNLDFVFTDGHAIDRISTFHYPAEAASIDTIIDLPSIRNTDFRDPYRKWRKQAELLIASDLPVNAILGYIVYDQAAKDKLVAAGVEEKNVFIKPDYYF